jgi:hypothetical protein
MHSSSNTIQQATRTPKTKIAEWNTIKKLKNHYYHQQQHAAL